MPKTPTKPEAKVTTLRPRPSAFALPRVTAVYTSGAPVPVRWRGVRLRSDGGVFSEEALERFSFDIRSAERVLVLTDPTAPGIELTIPFECVCFETTEQPSESEAS